MLSIKNLNIKDLMDSINLEVKIINVKKLVFKFWLAVLLLKLLRLLLGVNNIKISIEEKDE